MLLPQQLGLKVYHVNVDAQDATEVRLDLAGLLGPITTKPQLVGAVVIEAALGSTAAGIPHRIVGLECEIDKNSGEISVAVRFDENITRTVRIALLFKE